MGGNFVLTSCYAWYEWFFSDVDNGLIKISPSSLGVSPGDLVTVTVCCPPGGSYATSYIGNLTQNTYTSIPITPPYPQSEQQVGATAEWIVERESNFQTLANYGEIFFTDCLAGWGPTPSSEIDLSDWGGANTINMWNPLGDTISTAVLINNTTLECYYGDKQP